MSSKSYRENVSTYFGHNQLYQIGLLYLPLFLMNKEMHPEQACTWWYELRRQKWTMPWIKQETHLIHYCTLSLVHVHGPSIWAAGYMSSQTQAAVKLVQEWKFNYKCHLGWQDQNASTRLLFLDQRDPPGFITRKPNGSQRSSAGETS